MRVPLANPASAKKVWIVAFFTFGPPTCKALRGLRPGFAQGENVVFPYGVPPSAELLPLSLKEKGEEYLNLNILTNPAFGKGGRLAQLVSSMSRCFTERKRRKA